MSKSIERLKQFRQSLEQQKGKQIQVQHSRIETRARLKEAKHSLRQLEQAREVVRTVGLETQQQLQYHISDITSLALEAVFDNPYQLIAEFVQRRNKTECDLLFERDGERMNPLSASGGGTVDIAAFALRIASWSMQNPKSRNVIILDEPLRFLSEDHQERASQMIKELSERLGIQFIIITHNQTLTTYADRTFVVSNMRGVSKIK